MPTRPLPSPRSSDLLALGLRPTLPRQAVMAVFQAHEMRHLSAEDVYRHAHTQGTTMSLSTVYKVLSQFEQVACCAAASWASRTRCTSGMNPRPPATATWCAPSAAK